ncbi:MAG TPA: preprotein translocase subunit YajC [Candidatus Polarisedimenticolia bacterium]|nr:preprotein translocase subunit YajC [Candidatus Polarisedimenticolia bacterium]
MIHGFEPVRGMALMAAQAAPGAQQPSFFSLLAPMAIILVIFYFFLIRPANKKQKAVQEMIGNLKNGDKIITTGGVHGVVAGITDEIIQLRVAPNVKIDISRSAVAALQKEQGE